MEDNNLSGNESIRIIEQMIGRAKEEEKDNGLGWIVWGWMLFLASIINYILIVIDAPHKYIIWNIFGGVAIVYGLYNIVAKKYFRRPVAAVRTYTNELVNRLGIAFFVSLMIMVFGNAVTGVNQSGLNFAYLLLLYGFWMFIHASAFRFELLKGGAIINWIGAIIIFISYKELGKNILLVHAACVALGYIIPGHIARKRFGRNPKGQDKQSSL
jgi:hypothetical protein